MNITEIYDLYKKNFKPLPRDIKSIEKLIKEKFKGYEIPLTSWAEEEYRYDDHITEEHLYKLFHVNDEEVLVKYLDVEEEETEEEKAMFLSEYTEEEWIEINRKHYREDMKYIYNYDTLITKHNEYKAFTIILESIDNKEISAFKVLGPSQKAFNLLVCYIGNKGMKEGDLEDSLFRKYLKCLYKQGFLTYTCPICGYDQLEEPPYNDKGYGSYEICSCCNFEYGFDDFDFINKPPFKITKEDFSKIHTAYRKKWIEEGCIIYHPEYFPAEQMINGHLKPQALERQLSNIKSSN